MYVLYAGAFGLNNMVEGLKLEYFALDNDMYFKLFKAIKMLKLFKCHLTT